ncbi:MAG: polymer-forming cytoskeletal protein [Methylobacterium sp.]|nr:polymer-forming cytoskeletal protein [Methylobacterium sp.]
MISFNRQKPQNRIDTLIGAETVVEGDIDFSGGLRVDGCVRGNINELGAKSGTLVLSEHGRVEGSINVSHAVINGTVLGPVNARAYVELQSKSKVTGDVRYKTLEIHMGAVVEGKLVYNGEPAVSDEDDESPD